MYIKEREARINAEKALNHLARIFNGPAERLSYARWLRDEMAGFVFPSPSRRG
jgi:hypothetical protein